MVRPLRIMIVDDKPVVHNGLKRLFMIFDDINYAGSAMSGKDAIAQYKQLKPDIVLMDIVMPEMNGIETTRVLKRYCSEILIIGLTGIYTSKQQQEAIIEAGAVTCVLKDDSIEDIVNTIRNVYKTSKS